MRCSGSPAARAHVPTRPGDHHTNLGWDDVLEGLTTHALPRGTVLGLNISRLTLVLGGDGADLAQAEAFDLEGRRDAEESAGGSANT